jgi:alpha-methylacyl-CoA racemase
MTDHAGPLRGLRVLELGGIGPAPFAGMMLCDLGADVIRLDRPAIADPDGQDPLSRGKRSLLVDLKNPDGRDAVLRGLGHVDILLEGFRPGVTERLGIGPAECLTRNKRLVYGRISAFGQDGPFAQAPAHDINCLALAGVLAHVGTAGGPPVIPLNIIGDFGAGGMLLAYGVMCAALAAARSGRGQVVDASMLDGLTLLMASTFAMLQNGSWLPERGVNLCDGGAPFYNVYRTLDGGYVSVGAIEPQFFAAMLTLCGAANGDEDVDALLAAQHDRAGWPALTARLRTLFAAKTRKEWEHLADQHKTCLAPVLGLTEAPRHPHLVERGSFLEIGGIVQPSPAPRFSETPGAIHSPAPRLGQDTRRVLTGWGLGDAEVDRLLRTDAIGESRTRDLAADSRVPGHDHIKLPGADAGGTGKDTNVEVT